MVSMAEDPTNPKLRLVGGLQHSPADKSQIFPLVGEAEFPGPPAMPHALVQLELCLSASVVDLQDVTNIIRNDVGLTVQLLRVAAREAEVLPGKITPISEIVVQVGVDKLAALAAQTKPVPDHLISACERFWTHSKLTALIAEELASQFPELTLEEAYLAGLLCHLGDLSSILGWATEGPQASRYIGYRMAKAWGFPALLTDLIGSYGEVGRTGKSHALLDIMEAADKAASRLERQANRGVTCHE